MTTCRYWLCPQSASTLPAPVWVTKRSHVYPDRNADPTAAAAANRRRTHRDGEEELYNSWVAEDDPAKKMQTNAALGGVLAVTAVVIATICHKDPWGEGGAVGRGTHWDGTGLPRGAEGGWCQTQGRPRRRGEGSEFIPGGWVGGWERWCVMGVGPGSLVEGGGRRVAWHGQH